MPKHFKTKKKWRQDIILKYVFLIVVSFIVIKLCFSLLTIPTLNLTFKHNKLQAYKNYLTKTTLNNPESLLLYYNKKAPVEEALLVTYIKKEKPLIYIYNTHQREAYTDRKTVLDAALYMKEIFKIYNIDTIVETQDITEFMKVNNMTYNYSYYASRFYIKDAIKKNELDFIIDLHRDASSRKATTTSINKKNYAKILFVVGKEHKNYQENYHLAKKINSLITNKYPNLSRGVMLKSGKNVNGIYNQDLNNNMILLEIGGNYNSYNEVKNTISLIVPIIGEYLYEK